MIRQQLEEHLIIVAKEAGFAPAIAALLDHARECIYITNKLDNSADGTGASKLGGVPDLPSWAAWPPPYEGLADSPNANFIVQLNFAQLPLIPDLALPRAGYIWMFMRGWPKSGIEVPIAVLYEPNSEAPLSPQPNPNNGKLVLEEELLPLFLDFRIGISLPLSKVSFRHRIRRCFSSMPPISIDRFAEALVPDGDRGQIGGFANSLGRYDFRRIWALRALGRDDLRDVSEWDKLSDLAEFMVLPGKAWDISLIRINSGDE